MSINSLRPGGGASVVASGATDGLSNAVGKIPLVGGLLSSITRGIGGLASGGLSKIFGG